ncbi:MAG: DUF1294 domain-containing protein [Chloroflexota bacterium]
MILIEWWRNPRKRFRNIGVFLILLAGLVVLIADLVWWQTLIAVLFAVNAVTLLIYRYDKGIAGNQNRTRVPETTLLLLAFVGGSPAAFVAIYLFRERHKAQKTSFVMRFWAIVIIQVLIVGGVIWFSG